MNTKEKGLIKANGYAIDFDEYGVEVYKDGQYVTDCLNPNFDELVKIERLSKFTCFKGLALKQAKKLIGFD